MRILVPNKPAAKGANTLTLSLWFGLITGLGEVALHGIKKFVLHKTLHLSPHVVWMAPLANVVLFGFVGVILLTLGRRWSKLRGLNLTSCVFSFLGFLSLLLMYPRFHYYAVLLLAGGLAIQTARIIAGYPTLTATIVRRTFGWLVAVVLAFMVAAVGWERLAENLAVGKLPPATSNAPNVLLIVLDTVRAKSLSVYGYERPTTPQLEGLSKSGVLFERAIATAPWTLPSHASMFTGRYPYELSLDWLTPLGTQYRVLAETLSEQGYLTGGFVANLLYCTYEFGLHRGFAHYEDFQISPEQLVASATLVRRVANAEWLRKLTNNHRKLGYKTAAQVNRDLLGWLSRIEGRPFFAFLNYFDAHTPYLPSEPFASKFARGLRPLKGWSGTPRKWTPKEIQAEQDAYDGAIAYIDHHIGVLMEQLGKLGLLEDTLIIITSDHGEAFGEHGFMGHGNSLYLPELHVPLLIRFPSRVPEGRRIVEPASLRDLPATVVDLLQLQGEVPFPGSTLARYWNGLGDFSHDARRPLLAEGTAENSLPSWYPASKGDMKSLLSYPYYYIKNGDGREELYDLEQDPSQHRDFARSPRGVRLLESLRVSLDDRVNGQRTQ